MPSLWKPGCIAAAALALTMSFPRSTHAQQISASTASAANDITQPKPKPLMLPAEFQGNFMKHAIELAARAPRPSPFRTEERHFRSEKTDDLKETVRTLLSRVNAPESFSRDLLDGKIMLKLPKLGAVTLRLKRPANSYRPYPPYNLKPIP